MNIVAYKLSLFKGNFIPKGNSLTYSTGWEHGYLIFLKTRRDLHLHDWVQDGYYLCNFKS